MPNPLETMIEQAQIPGVSLAITSPAGDIVTQAAGVTNKATPQAVTDTTVFEAASLSKPVFAYLIIKMAERGELDLDRPLHEYVSEFGPPEMRASENYKQLTARMILSHQAGWCNEACSTFNNKSELAIE